MPCTENCAGSHLIVIGNLRTQKKQLGEFFFQGKPCRFQFGVRSLLCIRSDARNLRQNWQRSQSKQGAPQAAKDPNAHAGRMDRMDLQLATIGGRRAERTASPSRVWLGEYAVRIGRFCRFEHTVFASEEALLLACARAQGRRAPFLVLLDSRGKTLSSEALASWLEGQQQTGAQRIVFAIGPADGWSAAARDRAGLLLSLGPMTLAHELAAVVVAEQLYRAYTILQGLPYHLGHTS